MAVVCMAVGAWAREEVPCVMWCQVKQCFYHREMWCQVKQCFYHREMWCQVKECFNHCDRVHGCVVMRRWMCCDACQLQSLR